MASAEYLDEIDPDANYYDEFVNNIESNYHSIEQFNDLIKSNINSLNLINYNIRSFYQNSNYFLPLVAESMPNILILSETWFTSDYQDNIQGYESFHVVRSNRRSGGVSVFTRNDITAKKLDRFSYASDNIEVCVVEANISEQFYYIIAVYRPHGGTISNFTVELEQILSNSLLRNKRCIIAGDFNINLGVSNFANLNFIDSMRSYHMYPVITKPTRFPADDSSQPSLLDMIWTNSLNIFNSGIINFDTTDHCPTFLQLPLYVSNCNNSNELIKISFRVNNDVNRQTFSSRLSEFDWLSIVSEDPDAYTNNFMNALNDLYCDVFPLRTKNVSKKKLMNSWITNEIKDLVKRKSTYFELFRLGAISRAENNNFKNKVKSHINKAKSTYYRNLLNENISNMQKTWETINFLMNRTSKSSSLKKLIVNDIEYYDSKEISNLFNEFFLKTPLDLASNIPYTDIDPLHHIAPWPHEFLELTPCDSVEVTSIISKMKITKNDKDTIPIRLVISNRDILSPIIARLLNACMGVGIFPNCLKSATVLPIFKNKGDACDPTNYRPISLLPFLSKIFEKILYIRLISHLSKFSVLSSHQFGFRKNLSTFDAIVSFTENIYNALNNRKSIINIFIDFCKAFDTVNHRILFGKLEKYGVHGLPLSILANFLRDRKQVVIFQKVLSRPRNVNIGVPQGSILGPLLFLIFVNDLPRMSQKNFPVMFADDCTLQLQDSDLSSLIMSCNTELEKLKNWTNSNKMTINVTKTNCMLVSNVHGSLPSDSLFFNNESLNCITDTKFLGLVIDNKLKFNKHIESICSKISKTIGILFRLSSSSTVPQSSLKLIYYSLIHPFILYCLPIYAATNDIHIHPLITLQKRAVRILNKASFYQHTEPLFYASNILKFLDQYKLYLAVYIFKNPEIINTHQRMHSYGTRFRENPLPPFERLRSSQQSVIFNAIKVWNDIPQRIKESGSVCSFKFQCKCFLIEHYNH